ncbi:hypothetical protein GJ744_007834 [Endocarpon pusillum]|uniref:Uncharacterized protein n=1 Tax=Endocarpon pusillum TaxID=364733 RepID=A0A8H7ARA0_9EURO|nr:hypothetical protein GJ744_007834 [Endocarpon pusillum]
MLRLAESVLAVKGVESPPTAQHDRRRRASTQGVARAAKSSSSFSTRQITNAGLSRPLPPPSTSIGGTAAARHNRARNGNINAAPSSDDHWQEDGPLDEHLIKLFKRAPDPEDHMPFLRALLKLYRTLRYDGWKFHEKYEPHIVQLSRVIEQLENTGVCVIGGKIIRP